MVNVYTCVNRMLLYLTLTTNCICDDFYTYLNKYIHTCEGSIIYYDNCTLFTEIILKLQVLYCIDVCVGGI